MAARKTRTSPADIFDQRILTRALKSLGDYVYGYFDPGENEPFYVGKGQGRRVLSHWSAACANSEQHRHYARIREILDKGKTPTVKILAHNLENTKRQDVNAVVERVLQNTFGLERNVEDNVFQARLNKKPTLLQDRNDGKNYPVLSLEAAYCKGGFDVWKERKPQQLTSECGAPMLLVGLSKSFHPSYSQADLSEMARMCWILDKFENTTFPSLRHSTSAVLAAWTSKFGGPQIVGVWRIQKGSFVHSPDKESKRYKCSVSDDGALRKMLLGTRLLGTGHTYQGPHIYLPT